MTLLSNVTNIGLDIGLGSIFGAVELYGDYAMPLKNNKIAVIGDSIPDFNSFAGAAGQKLTSQGMITQARYLSKQRFFFDDSLNFGVSGENSTQILARVPTMLAATDAGCVIFDYMTNDTAQSIPLATSISNYQAAINLVVNAGRLLILIPPRPRDGTLGGLTATQQLEHIRRRQYVLGLQNLSRGILVCDVWNTMADPASTVGAPLSGYTRDGLHITQSTAQLNAKELCKIIGEGDNYGLYPPVEILCRSNTDLYNATSNPSGCLNSNPMMQGGTTVATGYTLGAPAGLTVVGSKVSSGGKTWQQIVLSGTATSGADNYILFQDIASNLSVGDVVEAACDFECDSAVGLFAISLAWVDKTGGWFIYNDMSITSDTTTTNFSSVAHKGVMRTPRGTMQSTTTGRLAMIITPINGAAVTATFRVGAMSLRKVV